MKSKKVWTSKTDSFESIKKECLEKNLELIDVYFKTQKDGRNATHISYVCKNHKEKGIQESPWKSMKKSKQCKYCARVELSKTKIKNGNEVYDAFVKNGLVPQFKPEDYKKNSDKLPCICEKHPQEGILYISYVYVRINTTACPSCYRETMQKHLGKTHEQFVQEVKEIHGDQLEVLDLYTGANTKLMVKHSLCGIAMLREPRSILKGFVCAKCAGVQKKTNVEFLQELHEVCGDEIIAVDEYDGVDTKIRFQHNIEGCQNIWETTPYVVLKLKSGCPACNLSHGERTVTKYLKDNIIKYQHEFVFPDCRNIHALSFDFAVFDKADNLLCLIEYDGELHYEPARFSKDKSKMLKKLEQLQHNDQIKNQYCINNNIKLLRIPYWDFDNIEVILDKYLLQFDEINKCKV